MPFIHSISSPFSDAELVQKYKQTASLEVLGELYQRYMDLTYGVCLKYLKDSEDAKDTVLNIFEELITKLLKYDVENFKSWLHQVAKNHCLMRLRASKNHKKVSIDPTFMQLTETVHLNGELENEEHYEKLQYCIGQLDQEQRRVIELFYLQEKCYNKIAVETGLEWNKVRSYIQNGRRNLKICMDKKIMNSQS